MDWTAVLTPSLGATGLLAGFVIAILTGRLLPKAGVDERLADKDHQIATWRSAYERALEVQDEHRAQVTALVEANQTTTHMIKSLSRVAGLNEGKGRAQLAEAEGE